MKVNRALIAEIVLSGKAIVIIFTVTVLASLYTGLASWSLHSKFAEERSPVLM